MKRRFGAYIPHTVPIGKNVAFAHQFYGIFIRPDASIGDDVTIFQHVTIGTAVKPNGERCAPRIGDNVLIGANATLIGRCVIGSGSKIGAGVTLVDVVIPPGSVIVNKSAFNLTEGRPVYA